MMLRWHAGEPGEPTAELFALDSDCHQLDGTIADSLQGQWLKQALTNSRAD
jgi:hypothetical protein